MGPKRKLATSSSAAGNSSTTSPSASNKGSSHPSGSGGQAPKKSKDFPPLAGYLISCDVPTKQYIQYLNEVKPVDQKFILEDLDATHLLIKRKAREEIERKVEAWMDENVFSAVERVGENLDMS